MADTLQRWSARDAARHVVDRLLRAQLAHRLSGGRTRMLFVVGHMRSGSTLLVHLLAAHPQVVGYGETRFHYRGAGDFPEVSRRILRSFGRGWCRERYVLDKVLHREYGLTPELAQDSGARVVLVIRRPREALPSILARNLPAKATPGQAAQYYIERLDDVTAFAQALGPERAILVHYEALVERSRATLDRLGRFLDLSPGLEARYDTMWSTGHRKIGDDSATIRAGSIVRPPARDASRIPHALMERAAEAYARCTDRCTHNLHAPHAS